jgi:hypothetical protein
VHQSKKNYKAAATQEAVPVAAAATREQAKRELPLAIRACVKGFGSRLRRANGS